MVQVTVWGSLKAKVGGHATVEVEAANIQQMLAALGEQHPALKPVLKSGVSVVVDGTIYRDAWLQPLKPDSEIYLLPRLAGG